MYEVAAVGIIIVLFVVALLIGVLIGAVILRAAVSWVEKERLGFGRAFGTAIVMAVANVTTGLIFHFGLIAAGIDVNEETFHPIEFLSIPINLLVHIAIIAYMLSLSFGRALLVVLAMVAIYIGIAIVAGGIVLILILVL